MPTSVNLHRTAPRLEDKHVKIGGQIGNHLNLSGGVDVSQGAINEWVADRDDFLEGGVDSFLLCQIGRNVDVGFAFDESEESGRDGFCITWGDCDDTESSRISRGYHFSSQVVVLQFEPSLCVSVIPELAYYTTAHTLTNFTTRETNESDGEGFWVRMPLLIGFQTPSDSPVGASLMTGPDVIYARYDISTRLISFSGRKIVSGNQMFSNVIPGAHVVAAIRIYFLEAFFESWRFFPEDFPSVGGASLGLSFAF